MAWRSLLVMILATIFAVGEANADLGRNGKRLLRVDNLDEERGLISALASIKDATKKASKSVGQSIRTQYWVEVGKTDEQVKKALKIDKLSGAALTGNKNYKIYQQFMYKQVGSTMDNLVKQGTSTYKVWESLGLSRFPMATVKSTNEYKLYARYVNKYDDEIIAWKNSVFEPKIHYGSKSAKELEMKTEIWAEAGRKRWYAKEMLGLDGLRENVLTSATNYKFLERFDDLARAKKAKK